MIDNQQPVNYGVKDDFQGENIEYYKELHKLCWSRVCWAMLTKNSHGHHIPEGGDIRPWELGERPFSAYIIA